MLHPGPLTAATLDITVEPGAAAALDGAAGAADPTQSFLRAAWFASAAESGGLATLVARRDGAVLAAMPLVQRRLGPLTIRQVAGSYWPYRGVPIATDADDSALESLLGSRAARAALGRAWRLGPVYDDNTAAIRLAAAARRSGWRVLRRTLATCFVIDLRRLTSYGSWPSTKTLQHNRRHERRLAEAGQLDYRSVSGAGWCGAVFDQLAAIEAESWIARAADGDPKFLKESNRRVWERAVADPELAARLGASILTVGGVPAAFNFTLRVGDTLHVIANSYSERFADRRPGRILLYRDFQQAAADGMARIDWGAGDAGYKSEMGATPGPEIIDLLFVRGRLPALVAARIWR